MRKIILPILIILLAAALAAGGWWLKQKKSVPTGSVLPNKERNLTQDQQKIYNDRIAKAQSYLASLKPSQPNFKGEQINTYVYLGQQYYGLGQLQKSKEMYGAVLALAPNHEQALVGLALTLHDAGDAAGERRLFEQALKSNPNNPDVWLRYIDLRQALGASAQELSDLYAQALEQTSRNIDVVTRAAGFQEQAGNLQASLALWQEAAKQYPDETAYREQIKRLQKLIK